MSQTAARWMLVFTILGLAASTASTYVHYKLIQSPSYTSVCDVNATVSCTTVYQSRFSTLAGVPVAVPGLLFFVLVGLLLAAWKYGPDSVRENVPGYLFFASTPAMAVVLYLGYASFMILHVVCMFCAATNVAVLGIFLVSGAATPIPLTALPGRVMKDLRVLVTSPVAAVIALVFLGGAGSVVAFFPRESTAPVVSASTEPTEAQASEFEKWWTSQPRVPVMVPTDDALVVVVKFQDYQCPPCRQTHFDYKSILSKYKAQKVGARPVLKYVTLDYPLDSECNPPVKVHEAACEAAAAVRMARLNNRGEELEEWLYSNQSSLNPAVVKQAARDIGLVKDFDARFPQVLETVKADVAMGKQLRVEATPTFFINGVKVQGGLPVQWFDAAIAYELKRAQQK